MPPLLLGFNEPLDSRRMQQNDMDGRKIKKSWLKKFTPDLAVWTASFVLSLAQWRHVVLFFDPWLILQAEQGILDGYPHWRLFQSRVLGPWLEEFLMLLGFKLSQGHAIIASCRADP